MEEGIEGCLSLPEMAGMVPRYTKIRYRATDLEGNAIDVEAEGYHARVVQHECDHLDGVLYPMRMSDLSKLGYAEEMSKAAQGPYTDAAPEEERMTQSLQDRRDALVDAMLAHVLLTAGAATP